MRLVFSVFDLKAQEYGPLYLAQTTEVGQRMFADSVLGPHETLLKVHPEDFELHEIGSFDEESGKLLGDEIQVVCSAFDIVRRAAARSPGDPLLEVSRAG